ncbi:hypothetical protein RF11_12758 [Thelohanellus kitauei]|uniref:Uncharacterized protein n=1 Tax=Thelohanellus kitauei TaxID=669202 RepID=A0A0C2MAJ2_THEKT|nr:hypothetical protein RF11_12758 [Thelohanellus kitauei]
MNLVLFYHSRNFILTRILYTNHFFIHSQKLDQILDVSMMKKEDRTTFHHLYAPKKDISVYFNLDMVDRLGKRPNKSIRVLKRQNHHNISMMSITTKTVELDLLC